MSNNFKKLCSLKAYIEAVVHCKSLVAAQKEEQFESHSIKAFQGFVQDQLYIDEGVVKKYPTLQCSYQRHDPCEVINVMKRDDPDLEGILVCMANEFLIAWTWAQDIADAEEQLIRWTEEYMERKRS